MSVERDKTGYEALGTTNSSVEATSTARCCYRNNKDTLLLFLAGWGPNCILSGVGSGDLLRTDD